MHSRSRLGASPARRPSPFPAAGLPAAAFLALTLLAAPAARACPLCKESVREESASLSAGYNASTLVMLGGLFSLAGFGIWLLARSASGSTPPGAPGPPPGPRGGGAATGARAPAPPALSGEPPARSR